MTPKLSKSNELLKGQASLAQNKDISSDAAQQATFLREAKEIRAVKGSKIVHYTVMASRLVLVLGDLFIPDRAPVNVLCSHWTIVG